MQVKALDVVKVNFNNQVVSEIDDCIDVEVEDKKNSSYAISRIAFDCVNGLTGADHPLQKNSGVKRIWDQAKEHLGSQAGRNAELYFYQQILMKLAEKNLLSFDLITAINNRLNSSLLIVDDEFNRIRTGLGKFLRMNRNELAKLEGRLANVERNITLLNWQNAIEYQDLDGIEYAELDDEAKIVCLVRDFYDITGGVWSTSDLLLLKTAMSTIGIKPKDTVNYFEALAAISKNEQLKTKLLGNKVLRAIKEPAYLIPMSGIKKYASLQEEEKYIVESVSTILSSQNAKLDEEAICDNLTKNYLACEAFVDTDRDVDAYDLLLDMLLNLRHVEAEGILVDKEALEVDTPLPVINNKVKGKSGSYGFEICQENVGECLEEIAKLKASDDKEELVELYEAMVAADIPEGYLHLGNAYYYGEGVEQSYARARKYYEAAAEKKNGEAYYMMSLMVEKKQGFSDNNSKIIELLEASIECGYAYAYYALGQHYYAGKIVPQNYKTAYENFMAATEYGIGEAYTKLGLMYYYGLYVNTSYKNAVDMWLKAEELGDMLAYYHIGCRYFYGDYWTKDYRRAEEYYIKAAKAGNADAYWKLHVLYEDNNKITRDLNKATKYLALGAKLGDTDCIADLRYHISAGHVAKDTDVSFLDKIID